DADLARSLNNVSNHYATLAELETTREGRLIWLRKAVDAVEDAIAMRRALGIQADLASSLHNVSNRYGEMAGLEPARDARRTWLQKAIHAAEEGVAIQDALGIRGAMAMSLNSMSNRCAQLAEMEPAREGWDAWLRKAIEAAEASVEIQRELGVPGDLAVSLGSLGNRFHMRASAETDRTRRMDDLRSSRDAAEEAGRLFRAAGEIKFLLLSLQDLVSAHGLLAEMGDPADVEILRALCLEGNQLARSMRDGEAEAFFTGILDWIE
ncbi:MAG TPA: hypothetical protein VHG91_04725, partial [Longimicrobium sp.]|nr:hypothetical protein [Longimicrobium sp.]